MSAYDNDWRVVLVNGSYIVGMQWAVMEQGGRWDAHPYPACTNPAYDYDPVGGYRAGTATADEKIRELIGDPR